MYKADMVLAFIDSPRLQLKENCGKDTAISDSRQLLSITMPFLSEVERPA